MGITKIQSSFKPLCKKINYRINHTRIEYESCGTKHKSGFLHTVTPLGSQALRRYGFTAETHSYLLCNIAQQNKKWA